MALTRSSVLYYWSSRYGVIPLVGGRPSHARNAAGKVADGRGEYYDAIINTPRFSWETDKATSANERRAMLALELARTNSILWSRDLTNAAWTSTNTGSAVFNGTGLDGSANAATWLNDADAAAAYVKQQSVTIANDGATHTVRFWFAKDTNTTRFPSFQVDLINGGTPKTVAGQLNTSTGATSVVAGGGGGTFSCVSDGAFWLVECVITNNTTGNTALRVDVYPAHGTVLGTFNAAATGAVYVGQIQVELNAPVGSSPIVTTSAAATRGADLFSHEYASAGPQAMAIYLRFVERGTIKMANARLLQISAPGDTTPQLVIYNGGSTYTHFHHNGVSSASASVAGTPAYLDGVELAARLFGDGSVGVIQSINGAAVTDSGSSGALTLAGAWSAPPKLYLNSEAASGANYGISAFAEAKIVKLADIVAATAQGIMDELRAFELGPNGDVL